MPIPDILIILRWWIILLLAGLSCIPLTLKVFPSFFDKGYIFSKVLGIIIISYLVFLLGTFHIVKFSQVNSFFVLAAVAIFNYGFIKIDKKIIGEKFKYFLFEEIFFLITLFAWCFIRGTSPDIHGLEKFMDFGFINSALRSDFFPPKDIWLTPLSINYYYFGHLAIAVLTKMSDIKSSITFNLAVATMFAFTFTQSYSLGANLVYKFQNKISLQTITAGIISAFFISLGGNLQTIYAFFKSYSAQTPVAFWNLAYSPSTFPNSYWYPNATRFIFHTIHEFPIYSFVVSDLHAHVLSLPFVMLTIALLLSIFNEGVVRKYSAITLSLTLACLYMTNTWDIATYFLLTICVVLFTYWKNKSLSSSTLTLGIITLLTFIFIIPFSLTFKPFSEGIGVLCAPQFLINIGKIGPFIFEPNHCQLSPLWQLLILYGFFIFTSISFIIFLLRNKSKIVSVDYFILILMCTSTVLIILPEIIYVKDIYSAHYRANTMFKFTYQAFIMLQLSSAYIIVRILKSIRKTAAINLYSIIFFVFLALMSFMVFSYPVLAVNSYYNNLKSYAGLDGVNYLKNIYPNDYLAINWINSNIKGQPLMLEAQGDSYTDYERISTNTGLPTILGWTVHEWLWRGTYNIPAPRVLEVQTIYQTENIELTKKLLKKYDVSYVYIGTLERQKYPLIAEDKFPKMGKIVFESGETKIYKINY